MAADRSTVRRVRWMRGRSVADPSRDRKDWPPIRWAGGCRKLTMRSVVVESSGGVLAGVCAAPDPVGLGFKFTAAIVPSWVLDASQ